MSVAAETADLREGRRGAEDFFGREERRSLRRSARAIESSLARSLTIESSRAIESERTGGAAGPVHRGRRREENRDTATSRVRSAASASNPRHAR